MCEPTSITMAAMAVVSTAMTMYSQSEQAGAMEDYQIAAAKARNQEIEDNYALASASARNQYSASLRADSEASDAAAREHEQNRIEAAQARATLKTSAGEAGAAGLSLEALLADFYGQEERNRAYIDQNLGYRRDQNAYERDSIGQQAQGRVQAIRPYLPEPVAQPNYLGEAAKLGVNLAGIYSGYETKAAQTKAGQKKVGQYRS